MGHIHRVPPPIVGESERNLQNLEALGVKVDPATGKIVSLQSPGIITSDEPDTGEGSADFSAPGSVSHERTVRDFGGLDTDEGFADTGFSPEPEDPARGQEEDPEEKALQRLEQRQKDAKEAQRGLSKLIEKIDRRFKGLEDRFAELEQVIAKVKSQPDYQTVFNPADDDTINYFRENFADTVGVIEAFYLPLFQAIQSLQAEVGAFKADSLSNSIESRIPGAKAIVMSEPFKNWLREFDPEVREAYVQILERGGSIKNGQVNPDGVVRILRQYAKESGTVLHEGAAPAGQNQPPQRQARPDSMPRVRSSALLPTPNASESASPDMKDTPLSEAELASFNTLVSNARGGERDILIRRFRLTKLNLSASPQDFNR